MAKGRKAMPTEMKKALGNPGHRSLNDHEPRPEPSDATPPESILGDKVALKKWQEVAPSLARLRVLSEVDHGLLEAYCVAYSTMTKNEAVCRRDGDTYMTEGKNGVMFRARPERNIADNAAIRMKNIAAELGLTPAARTRLRQAPNGQLGFNFASQDEERFFGAGSAHSGAH